MTLRNLTLTAGLLGILFTNTVFALGMGELKLNSSLNEPLDAEIELLNTGDLSELEMLIGLGSRDDFEAAGVERLFLLTDLRFKVDMSNPDKPMIRISSRKPIREPYLDFLLDVQWPSGRLLREYTLLMDLPVYATERASAKKIKAASASPQPPKGKQVQASSAQKAPSRVAPQAKSSSGSEYRVASGDTAWGIAKQIKPGDATIMQSLAAIKQSNPNAFINGNINLLKTGAVLRLPSSSEISQLSHQDVNSEIDFDPESSINNKSTETQLDAMDSTVDSPVAHQVDTGGRLKLAAPNDGAVVDGGASGGSSSGVGGGSTGRGTEALENEFAIFQEELDKTQRENAELKARLSNMEEQIATMSRLVEINDDSLRAAQVASQQAIETEGASEVADAVSSEFATEAESELQAGGAVSKESAVEAVSTEEGMSGGSESSTPAKKGGFDLDGWIDLLLYPFIILLVILLAIVLFFKNRKQDDEETEELSLKTLVEKEDAEEEDESAFFDEDERQVLGEISSDLDEQDLKNLEELELTEGEDVDPLGEADIYLSLDNYKQAESVLLGAIAESPDDASLRLKLLEVYVSSKELDKFDEQYQELTELSNSEIETKIASLRAELVSDSVDEEIFEHNFGAIDEGESDDDSEESIISEESLSLDLTEDTSLSLVEGSSLAESSSLEDIELNFDGLDSDSEDDLPDDVVKTEKNVASESISDFDLDLDLEDIDLDSLSLDIDAGMESIDLEGSGLDGSSEPDIISSADPKTDNAIVDTVSADDFDDFDDDLDLLAGEDECSTKLELAQAYLDMGDPESAKEILDEVVSLGDAGQQDQARKLLEGVA
ncbi:MAG: FimV/HubP family polar landmark protein [Porticoccus sp.]|nr:FimV/HubP family polar landmark protein [Porticoccus sp.]